jgi:hypothetical protein
MKPSLRLPAFWTSAFNGSFLPFSESILAVEGIIVDTLVGGKNLPAMRK